MKPRQADRSKSLWTDRWNCPRQSKKSNKPGRTRGSFGKSFATNDTRTPFRIPLASKLHCGLLRWGLCSMSDLWPQTRWGSRDLIWERGKIRWNLQKMQRKTFLNSTFVNNAVWLENDALDCGCSHLENHQASLVVKREKSQVEGALIFRIISAHKYQAVLVSQINTILSVQSQVLRQRIGIFLNKQWDIFVTDQGPSFGIGKPNFRHP